MQECGKSKGVCLYANTPGSCPSCFVKRSPTAAQHRMCSQAIAQYSYLQNKVQDVFITSPSPSLPQLTQSRLEGWFNVTTSSVLERAGKAASFSLYLTIQAWSTSQNAAEGKGQAVDEWRARAGVVVTGHSALTERLCLSQPALQIIAFTKQ